MLTNPFYPLSKPVKPVNLFSGTKVVIIFRIKKPHFRFIASTKIFHTFAVKIITNIKKYIWQK